jgi:hypothetical protein
MQDKVHVTPIRHRTDLTRRNLEDALRPNDEFVPAYLHPELPVGQRAHAGLRRIGWELVYLAGGDSDCLKVDVLRHLDRLVGGEIRRGKCQC